LISKHTNFATEKSELKNLETNSRMDTTDNLTISIPVYDFKWLILNVIENCHTPTCDCKPTGK
jgi:hypothetical protein